MFGPHLTIDLYGCDASLLTDIDYIFGMLDEMPGFLGMRKISGPHVIRYEGTPGSFDKGGVSAFVIIATSHISIHTFVEQKYASVDIFSCKEFDVEKALDYVSSKFKAKKMEVNLLSRGKEFPKEIGRVKAIVTRERGGFSPLHRNNKK